MMILVAIFILFPVVVWAKQDKIFREVLLSMVAFFTVLFLYLWILSWVKS